MLCPKCGAKVGAVRPLFKREAKFTCTSCNSSLRLAGYWWPILLPSLLVLVFPFDMFNSTITMLGLLFISIVAASYAALHLLVRVELASGTTAPRKS